MVAIKIGLHHRWGLLLVARCCQSGRLFWLAAAPLARKSASKREHGAATKREIASDEQRKQVGMQLLSLNVGVKIGRDLAAVGLQRGRDGPRGDVVYQAKPCRISYNKVVPTFVGRLYGVEIIVICAARFGSILAVGGLVVLQSLII